MMTERFVDAGAAYYNAADLIQNTDYAVVEIDIDKVVELGYTKDGDGFVRVPDDEFLTVLRNSGWDTMLGTVVIEVTDDGEYLYEIDVAEPNGGELTLVSDQVVHDVDDLEPQISVDLASTNYALLEIGELKNLQSGENYVDIVASIEKPLSIPAMPATN